MDPSSHANVDEILQRHVALLIDADFDAKVLRGSVTLTCQAITDNVKHLLLDMRGQTISAIANAETGAPLEFSIDAATDEAAWKGRCLRITLPAALQKDEKLSVAISFATAPDASAIQWLTPSQTAGKKKPYLFTQCQAIHARSMYPCQDSCAAKFTYEAKVSVPGDLVALMSAKRLGSEDAADGRKTFAFDQPVPMPSYLVALAIGDLVSRDIGPRSKVWCEPEQAEAAAFELADTDKYLQAAEEILGPYEWGTYDVLVLPPSFPYGGMENPMLTFATPTLIAGDRSNTAVIAHEIAHSWCGNLVTNKTWEHFWLNEGFTVFNEMKIVGKVHGEQQQHLSSHLTRLSLKEDVDEYGHEHPFTCLLCDLKGKDPDDAFSRVPYYKGFHFLVHLERLVGGPQVFEPFQREWIQKFKFTVATSYDFRAFFEAKFPDAKVDWDTWLLKPGMPVVENKFDETLVKAYTELAERWVEDNGASASADDIAGWNVTQTTGFLNALIGAKKTFKPEELDRMDALYKFSASKNVELLFRWYRLALLSNYEKAIQPTVGLLLQQGRMKFTRPLYKALYNVPAARELAVKTFTENRHIYHNICSTMVAKDLNVTA